MRKRWRELAGLAAGFAAAVLYWSWPFTPPAYEAVYHEIRLGMTREDVEKLVPPATQDTLGVTHLASGRWEGVVEGEVRKVRYDRDDPSLRTPLLKHSRLVKTDAEPRRWVSRREELLLIFEEGRVVEKAHCVYRVPNRVLDEFRLFVENHWPF